MKRKIHKRIWKIFHVSELDLARSYPGLPNMTGYYYFTRQEARIAFKHSKFDPKQYKICRQELILEVQ